MPKERNINLDIIRILACFMVVLMHSPMPSDNAVGTFLAALSYATAPCIGLFFMVSGALLLPVKTDYKTFLQKRFSKIVIPTVIWSLIYIAFRLYYSESEIGLLQHICSIPFSAQGEGVLWFMYTLAGLYLLAPILSAWVENATKREIELVLALWGITLCYPLISSWLIVNQYDTGILYYFTGYAGYFLLGYYMNRYPYAIKIGYSTTIAILGIALLAWLKHTGIAFDFYSLFWYQSIFIASFAASIWFIANSLHRWQNRRGRITPCISILSNATFGIYLIHILIMRRWLWQIPAITVIGNYAVQTMVIAITTFTLSAAVSILISKLPGGSNLTGYNARKKSHASSI